MPHQLGKPASADDFPRRAGAVYLSLAVLYGLYALQGLDDFSASISMLDRLIMTVGPSSVALALLVPVAVFWAAAHKFDLVDETTLGGRRRDWTWLGLMALGAYLSSAIGPPASNEMLFQLGPPGLGRPERPVSNIAVMTLVPVSIGIFAVVAGVAGALVGQFTKWMPSGRRHALLWAACVALLFGFCLPVVAVDALVARHGWSVAWLLVAAPLGVPMVAAWTLLRAQGHRLGDMLPVPVAGTTRRPLGPEAVDRLATAVANHDQEREAVPVYADRPEAEMASFLRGLRQAMLPDVAVSDSEVDRLVGAVIAADPAATPTPAGSVAPWRRFDFGVVGRLAVSCACLAVGLLLLGLLGGVPPHVGAAVGIGLLGSVASLWFGQRQSVPAPVPTRG